MTTQIAGWVILISNYIKSSVILNYVLNSNILMEIIKLQISFCIHILKKQIVLAL